MSQSPNEHAAGQPMASRDSPFRRHLDELSEMLARGISWSGHERNCCFLNLGSGRFANISALSGIDFPDDARALATADWDQDGDVDVWVTNRTAPCVRYLRNEQASDFHFVSLQLEGTQDNRDAIGARVSLQVPGGRTLVHTVQAGTGFLSQSSKTVHVGLGAISAVSHVEVRWPNGVRESFGPLTADQHYRLKQQSGQAVARRILARRQVAADSRVEQSTPTPDSDHSRRIVCSSPVPLPMLEGIDAGPGPNGSPTAGPRLVNLWATWCAPCLAELQELRGAQAVWQEFDLQIKLFCVDGLDTERQSATDSPALLLQRIGIPFVNAPAPMALVEKLQMVHNAVVDRRTELPVPTSFLIDAAGLLRVIYKGPVTTSQLQHDLVALRDGKLGEDEALPFAGHWIQDPPPFRPMILLGSLLHGGYIDAGLEYFKRHESLLCDDPEFARMLTTIAQHRLRRRDVVGAAAACRQAMEFDPRDVDAQVALAIVLQRQNDDRQAESILGRVLELDPLHAKAHLNLGEIYRRQGRLQEAAACYQKASECDPHDHFARISWVQAWAETGKRLEAIELLKGGVAQSARDASAQYQYAVAWDRLGEPAEAIVCYRRALELDASHAMAMNNLAWLLTTGDSRTTSELAEGLRWAQSAAAATQRRDFAILDTLAVAYAANGHINEAVAAAEAALALAPAGSPMARQIQARLAQFRAP